MIEAGRIATAAVVSAAVCGAVMPLVIRTLTRLELRDVPNERSGHTVAVPRGGGWAVLAGLAAGVAVVLGHRDVDELVVVVLAVGVFTAIGATDDVRGGLTAEIRLSLQLLTALVAAVVLAAAADHTGTTLGVWAVIGTCWIAGFSNSFNFMDGANGISAFVTLACACSLFAVGWASDDPVVVGGAAVVCGAVVGFVPFNVPTARVFLGDVGSYLIGSWLAVIALAAALHGAHPVAAFAPFSVYVADTAMTFFDRQRRGESWKVAHRDHVYQRLIDGGWSHVAASAFVAACSGACGALGLLALRSDLLAAVGTVGVGVVVIAYLTSATTILGWVREGASG